MLPNVMLSTVFGFRRPHMDNKSSEEEAE